MHVDPLADAVDHATRPQLTAAASRDLIAQRIDTRESKVTERRDRNAGDVVRFVDQLRQLRLAVAQAPRAEEVDAVERRFGQARGKLGPIDVVALAELEIDVLRET